MAGWNDLPTELTMEILRFFASGSAVKALDGRDGVSVMLVCHRFRAILEPILYASVSLPMTSRTSPLCAYAPLRCFTRAVASRPSLGRLVKELYVCCDDSNKPPRTLDEVIEEGVRECNDHVSDEETASILALLPDAWRDDISQLASAAVQKGLANGLMLRNGCPGLLILLLHLLPSLVSLHADCTHEFAAVTFAACGDVQGGMPAALRSVKSIDLRLAISHPTEGLILNVVFPFMLMPSVTKFSCQRVIGRNASHLFLVPPTMSVADDTGDSDVPEDHVIVLGHRFSTRSTPSVSPTRYPTKLALGSSPVTHMLLNDCVIEAMTLGFILSLPRRLISLQYAIHTRSTILPPFVPKHIYNGICTQKNSLTELSITCKDWYDFEIEGSWLVGSLSALICLQYLKLPAVMLITLDERPNLTTRSHRNPLDDLLPPSIVTIELDIGGNAFSDSAREDFLLITGLPYTLSSTSRCLPELRTFDLIDCRSDWSAEPSRTLPFWSDRDSWSTGHKIKFTMKD